MTDTYTGPGEFLTITEDKEPETVRRHVERYRKAAQVVWDMGYCDHVRRWLDCACGTGYGSRLLRRSSRAAFDTDRYIGVDRSRDAINIADAANHFTWARFIRGDISLVQCWLPALGQFDVILSLETIEHLTLDIQALWIAETSQALRTGGVFVLACPIGNDGPSSYNRYHLHEPSLDGLNSLLSRHFTSVEIETEEYVDTGGHDAVQAFAVCR